MKKVIQFIFLGLFILFSFYYTNKVALIVKNNNPMIKKINKVKNSYAVKSVNAIIQNDTIIPGVNGLTVNVDKSFDNMNNLGVFNEEYLVYDEKKPKINLEDNKDKIIVKGNTLKQAVSLIVENKEIFNYLVKNNIKVNTYFEIDTSVKENVTYLNNSNNKKTFSNIESILNRKKINTNICIINDNYNICKENQKYLVLPSKILNNSNILDIKKNIESGDIIRIKKNANLSDVKILIKTIYNNNLDIITIDKLIKENRS